MGDVSSRDSALLEGESSVTVSMTMMCFGDSLLTTEQEDLEPKLALELYHVLTLVVAQIRSRGSGFETEQVGEGWERLERMVKDQEEEMERQQQNITKGQQSHDFFKTCVSRVRDAWEATLAIEDFSTTEGYSSSYEQYDEDEPREDEKPCRPCRGCHHHSRSPLCQDCYHQMCMDIETYWNSIAARINERLEEIRWKKTLDAMAKVSVIDQSILTALQVSNPNVRDLATARPDRLRLIEEPAKSENGEYIGVAEREAIIDDHETIVLWKLVMQEDRLKKLLNYTQLDCANEFHQLGKFEAGCDVPLLGNEERRSRFRKHWKLAMLSPEELDLLDSKKKDLSDF